jgi:hypothetical protein
MASASTRSPERSQRLEAELARLEELDLGGLRAAWVRRYGNEPPIKRSRDILMRLLTWRMQEDLYGGLETKVLQTLHRLGQAFERDPDYSPAPALGLKPGLELARDWNGKRHIVRVTEDGFSYDGRPFGSLSEVARAITGTRWSGPVFFGLKGKRS